MASGRSLDSPDWLEISGETGTRRCVTLFPRGLPYHRRVHPQSLDTLLIVPGEDACRFRLAVGLDCRYPLQMALGLFTPKEDCVSTAVRLPESLSGWFLHVSAGNVLVTHMESLSAATGDEMGRGLRMRLLETEGRSVAVRLSAFRPFVTGHLTDFRAQPLDSLAVEEGALVVEVGAYQWLQLEARWE